MYTKAELDQLEQDYKAGRIRPTEYGNLIATVRMQRTQIACLEVQVNWLREALAELERLSKALVDTVICGS